MKIIAIDHQRCQEFDKTSYYVIPGNLTLDEASAIVAEAQEKYLDALDEFQKANRPLPVPNQITLFPNDSLTIGEAKRQIEDYNTQIAEYDRLHRKVIGSFDTHLRSQGLIPLWDYQGEDLTSVVVDWGHRHGENLQY